MSGRNGNGKQVNGHSNNNWTTQERGLIEFIEREGLIPRHQVVLPLTPDTVISGSLATTVSARVKDAFSERKRHPTLLCRTVITDTRGIRLGDIAACLIERAPVTE